MTEQRSLKRLVRERMARTGERYEAAHRVVTSRRGQGVSGEHRASSLARRVLAAAGLELSEPMVCGLGGGIGFLYAIFEYRQSPHPLLTIVAQHHPQPWLDAVAQNLGIEVVTGRSSSPAVALRKLNGVLDAGATAQIEVGRGLLPWHQGVPEEWASEPYTLVVAGRADDRYLIDDDGSGDLLELASADLVPAWAGARGKRFELTTVSSPPEDVDLVAGSRAAIAMTVAHMTGPVLGHAFDVNMGLSGMSKFAAELRATTKSGWAQRFAEPEAFGIAMTRLSDCLTWQLTSPGGTRPLYAAFLTEASQLSGWDLSSASAHATAAGATWTEIARVAETAAQSGDHAATLEALADLVDEAAEHEHGLVTGLRAAVA